MAKYKHDQDLEFLQHVSNEQLEILVSYLIKDKDGKKRYTESLTSNSEFKQAAGNYQKVWRLIATEIQLSGGDSIVNFFRNTGVLYREILIDVCKKLNIKNLDYHEKTEDIEKKLISELFSKAWEEFSESEREELKKELDINPNASLSDVLRRAGATSVISYQISYIVAAMMARSMSGPIVTVFTGRVAAFALGPIVAGLSLLPVISGPAYKVTVPLVIQISAMRQEYLQSYKTNNA